MHTDVTKNVVITAGSTDSATPVQTVTMTCIALPDELIFVDCGVFPKVASQFRSDMEKRFQQNTSHLLLTHTHWDHIFAMEAFEDVTVVASKVGIQYLKRNLKGAFSKEKREKMAETRFSDDREIADCIKNARLFLPHVGVKEELVIGSEKQIIFRVIEGHSKDSACVNVPAEQILCTGDNLLTCYAQLPGKPGKTLEIFNYWGTLDINRVIPGHGPVVGKEYIGKTRTYFEELISALEALKAQNLPVKDVLYHPSLPPYFGKNQPEWIEGGRYHTKWLERNIKFWYKWVGSSE